MGWDETSGTQQEDLTRACVRACVRAWPSEAGVSPSVTSPVLRTGSWEFVTGGAVLL